MEGPGPHPSWCSLENIPITRKRTQYAFRLLNNRGLSISNPSPSLEPQRPMPTILSSGSASETARAPDLSELDDGTEQQSSGVHVKKSILEIWPTEVLGMIADILDFDSLKTLRLVHSILNKMAVDRLFCEISVVESIASFERLLDMTNPRKSRIVPLTIQRTAKVLIYYSLHAAKLSRQIPAAQAYQSLLDNQEDLKHMTKALSCFKNLKTVIIPNLGTWNAGNPGRAAPIGGQELLPLTACPKWQSEEAYFSGRALSCIASAVHQNRLKPSVLYAGTGWGFLIDTVESLKYMFGNLHEIGLVINLENCVFDNLESGLRPIYGSRSGYTESEETLPTIFEAAQNVRKLSVQFCFDLDHEFCFFCEKLALIDEPLLALRDEQFHSMEAHKDPSWANRTANYHSIERCLGNKTWPYLHTLNLSNIYTTHSSLLKLILRHGGSLKILVLERPTLRGKHTQWPRFFKNLRQSMVEGEINLSTFQVRRVMVWDEEEDGEEGYGEGYEKEYEGESEEEYEGESEEEHEGESEEEYVEGDVEGVEAAMEAIDDEGDGGGIENYLAQMVLETGLPLPYNAKEADIFPTRSRVYEVSGMHRETQNIQFLPLAAAIETYVLQGTYWEWDWYPVRLS